jgi:hypothetical protein
MRAPCNRGRGVLSFEVSGRSPASMWEFVWVVTYFVKLLHSIVCFPYVDLKCLFCSISCWYILFVWLQQTMLFYCIKNIVMKDHSISSFWTSQIKVIQQKLWNLKSNTEYKTLSHYVSGLLEISMSLRLQYVGSSRNINGICKLS